ncbi:A24 family peptidase [Desulfovibrio mangrovi]|uniref:prepilin peptidase n=1 Tax=Desulfovibrio mangrovi TaxID=2976983 RepID=UPI0022452EEC|nr:A24 family peptidase [Desulfovibrio mangrovi]UZP66394.1 A24 family peptidase [Desulfovibrio mangrovi]
MNPTLTLLFPWVAGVFGLLLGSLYTICVHRYLSGAPLLPLRPVCPQCTVPLRWYDTIPLLGYALLRGRCRTCRRPIGIRYPLLELASCLWAAFAAMEYGPSPQWVVLMAEGGILIVASSIDVERYLLPDILTLPGAGIAIAVSMLVMGMSPLQVLGGSMAGAGLFWLLQRAYRMVSGMQGIGTGDVKLMLMLGAMCGLEGLPVLITVAGVAALLVHALVSLLGRRYAVHAMIPFGPFLSFGGMVQVLWGGQITRMLS